ncbi:WD40 domain-containing protein [Chitinophaga pinensis]|uniref:WD-40 repeat protein n=1 Tax=Chitinophaga pinensis (strain ATCC 43595 / DSM 2588 / LMG 13176 / NBRC 15968 / NCIMB 11800 / UQM 2034) TaxID=485918 RepID=A0A979GUQ6_CHIPD|nr:caspase family protein [Chitinophaga pinensis]ACU60904.1 WD-40 repeat protein [Chitinophaga pinensis DSM 2588]
MKRSLLFAILLFSGSVMAQRPKLVLPIGHAGFINDLSFSKDGKMAVTAGSDRTVKIWDVNTGLILADCQGHTETVNEVEFSPDNKWIISASQDQTARIWEVSSGKEKLRLRDKYSIEHVSVNYDGSRIITTAVSDYIRLCDGKTGDFICNLLDGKNFWNVEFSPDGKLVVASSFDDSVYIWDASTGVPHTIIKENSLFAHFSPGSDLIVTGAVDSSVHIWDVRTGNLVKTCRGSRARLSDATFSSDEKQLAVVTTEGDVQLWDVYTGKLIADWPDVGLRPTSIEFVQHDKQLLLSTKFEAAILLDARSGKILQSFDADLVRFSPDQEKYAVVAQAQATIRNVNDSTSYTSLRGHVSWSVYASSDTANKHIAVCYGDGSLRVWSLITGMPELLLADTAAGITRTVISPDGRTIAGSSQYGTISAWDLASGKLLYNKKCAEKRIGSMVFSHDGKQLLIGSGHKAAIVDAKDGAIRRNFDLHRDIIYAVAFSRNDSLVATASQDSTARIWNARTGEVIREITCSGWALGVDFSHNARQLLVVADNEIWVKSVPGAATIMHIALPLSYGLTGAVFSNDDKYIITTAESGFVCIYNVSTGKLLHELHGSTPAAIATETRSDNTMDALALSPDGNKIATGRGDGRVEVWDIHTGKALFPLLGHTDYVHFLSFSADGKYLTSLSKDRRAFIWDIKKRQALYSFFPVDRSGFLIQDPEGFYRCSHDAAKLLHYVIPENTILGFDQLDIRFNRPDILLARTDPSDTALIAAYHQAYLKRIRDLRIDTTQFSDDYSFPAMEITNRDSINFLQNVDTVQLDLSAEDDDQDLSSVNVWVNEVPIYGANGMAITSAEKSTFDTTLTITLSNGVNVIEAAAMNKGGISSYRYPKVVTYHPPVAPKEKVFFIGIGCRQFRDTANNLQWSVADVQYLADTLRKKLGDNLVIDTLFDSHVTLERVRQLKETLNRSAVNDKVILVYSGHGLLSGQQYFLSTYDVNFDNPASGGLPYEELYGLLDNIPARRKLLLIDACNSGELDTTLLAQYREKKESLARDSIFSVEGVKGPKVRNIGPRRLGMEKLYELTQELFVDVRKSNGANVIAASSAFQFAKEDNSLKHGVFTFSILEAFRNNDTLTLSQLKKIVEKRVPELTKGLQRPTSRNQTINGNWIVW